MINTSMSQCRFCGQPLDSATAQAAADLQERVSKACNDASYLKITARAMPVFYLISFIPVVGVFAGWGFLFLIVAVPVMALLWWIRFRAVESSDPDLRKAKRETFVALGIWAGMALVWMVISEVLHFATSKAVR